MAFVGAPRLLGVIGLLRACRPQPDGYRRTPQERADLYVSRMPTAVLADAPGRTVVGRVKVVEAAIG